MHPPASCRFEVFVGPTTERRNSKNKKARRRSRNTSISWAKKCHLKIIPSLNQYSEEEKSDTFYGPEDYLRMREETSEVTFLMKHGTKESEDLSYRGLEFKRDGEFRRRKLNRLRVNLAIFEENDKQFEQGYYDDEAIRDICRLLTESSRLEALGRAAEDARDAGQQCAPVPSPLRRRREDEKNGDDSSSLVNPLLVKNLMKELSLRSSNSSRKSTLTRPQTALSLEGERGPADITSILGRPQ